MPSAPAGAKPGHFPYMAVLFGQEGTKLKHYCGGTLIAANIILTAGMQRSEAGQGVDGVKYVS